MEAINIRMTEQTTAYFCGNIGWQAVIATCTFSSIESACGARTWDLKRAQMTVIICCAKFSFPFNVMKSLLLMCVSEISFSWLCGRRWVHHSAGKLDTVSLNVLRSDHKDHGWIILNHCSFMILHFYHTFNTELWQIFIIKWLNFTESTLKCDSLVNYHFISYCRLLVLWYVWIFYGDDWWNKLMGIFFY